VTRMVSEETSASTIQVDSPEYGVQVDVGGDDGRKKLRSPTRTWRFVLQLSKKNCLTILCDVQAIIQQQYHQKLFAVLIPAPRLETANSSAIQGSGFFLTEFFQECMLTLLLLVSEKKICLCA
jgi:hypothetical protein